MGVVTSGHLQRAECYRHGVIFAMASFLRPAIFDKHLD